MKTPATKEIEQRLWAFTHQKLGTYGCFEVTMGLGMMRDHKEIVDYITYNTSGNITCYEIKTSYSDFKSKNRLSYWGEKNYLVVTEDVWNKIESNHDYTGSAGVYVLSNNGEFINTRKSGKHNVSVGEKTSMLESMVRSMDREISKYKQLEEQK